MEQVKNLESNETNQRPVRRFGNHIPNKYSVINPAENPIFNQFANVADLGISLGSSVSFYVNKLNYSQFSELLETLPDVNSKRQFEKSQHKNNKPLNWLFTYSFTPQGKKPCTPLAKSIETYNGFDIDKDGKRITSFGYTDLTFDFSKLPLVKAEDGAPAYPYGIVFFSDIYNDYDNYNAAISCIPDRKGDVSHCNFIRPIDFDHKGIVHCNGKFRLNGNYIIFYVTNEIEKQEDRFKPDVTIINIPVTVFRDHKQGYIIKETDVCNIKKGSTCVSSFIEHIINIFKFYNVNNNQFIGEIIHAFGYDPLEYSYPPSLGDERSYYYGGNKVHMGSKENFGRYNNPFTRNNNIFNYLEEVNKKSNAKIVLPTPTNTQDTSESRGKKKSDKREKGINKEETEVVQFDDCLPDATVQIDDIQPEAVPQNDDTGGDILSEAPVIEAPPPPETSENAQLNEESPQSEDIGIEEVVENDSK